MRWDEGQTTACRSSHLKVAAKTTIGSHHVIMDTKFKEKHNHLMSSHHSSSHLLMSSHHSSSRLLMAFHEFSSCLLITPSRHFFSSPHHSSRHFFSSTLLITSSHHFPLCLLITPHHFFSLHWSKIILGLIVQILSSPTDSDGFPSQRKHN